LSGQRQPPRAARVKPFTITGFSLDDLAAALGLDQRLFYTRHRHKVRTVRCPIRDFVTPEEFARCVAAFGRGPPPSKRKARRDERRASVTTTISRIHPTPVEERRGLNRAQSE
jgi:hypothetical protein